MRIFPLLFAKFGVSVISADFPVSMRCRDSPTGRQNTPVLTLSQCSSVRSAELAFPGERAWDSRATLARVGCMRTWLRAISIRTKVIVAFSIICLIVAMWNRVSQECIAIEGNGRIFDSDFVNPIPCKVEIWALKSITYVLQSITPG